MIKASYEILQPSSGHSFLIRTFGKAGFEAPYHFHEEYELTYIVHGHGKRYVGSHMENFSSGDLVLLGASLPHCWKLEADGTDHEQACAIVIQFSGNFLGDEFLNKDEMQVIKKMLQLSACGICFNGATRAGVDRALTQLSAEKNNFNMLIGLLEILQMLAISNEYKLLDQQRSVAEQSRAEQERINPVFAYLVENFRGDISLDQASYIAHMTPTPFVNISKRLPGKLLWKPLLNTGSTTPPSNWCKQISPYHKFHLTAVLGMYLISIKCLSIKCTKAR